MTKQESIIQQLKDIGFQEVSTKSTKYIALSRSDISRNLYIGKKGAVRYGESISESIAITRPDDLIKSLQRKYQEET